MKLISLKIYEFLNVDPNTQDLYTGLMQSYFWILIIVIFVVIGTLKILLEPRSAYHYKKVENLLINSELHFYKFLLVNLPSNISIMCKVRLADIISPIEKGKSRYGAFNKVKSKHIDFVLIDSNTSEIKALIELNGSSHQIQNRINRDNFVRKLSKSVDLAFFEVKVKPQYERSDIEEILEFIKI